MPQPDVEHDGFDEGRISQMRRMITVLAALAALVLGGGAGVEGY